MQAGNKQDCKQTEVASGRERAIAARAPLHKKHALSLHIARMHRVKRANQTGQQIVAIAGVRQHGKHISTRLRGHDPRVVQRIIAPFAGDLASLRIHGVRIAQRRMNVGISRIRHLTSQPLQRFRRDALCPRRLTCEEESVSGGPQFGHVPRGSEHVSAALGSHPG